jgi:hypothetical protein
MYTFNNNTVLNIYENVYTDEVNFDYKLNHY